MLRQETHALFKQAGLSLQPDAAAITLDEMSDVFDCKNTERPDSIVLVDHNAMSHDFLEFSERVKQIVDHHRDEGQYKVSALYCGSRLHVQLASTLNGKRVHAFVNLVAQSTVPEDARVIGFDDSTGYGVGSTCTLIAQQILESSEPQWLTPEIATLLLGMSSCVNEAARPILS